MNRTLIAAVLICAAAAASSRAATSQPGIGGGVFDNVTGAPVAGVTLKLYADDGDGIFDIMTDVEVGPGVSGADGLYCFDDLSVDTGYFVQRPEQVIFGMSQPEDVSALLSPGESILLIDSFDNQQLLMADPNNPVATSALNDSMSSVLGSERDMYVEIGSGLGEVALRSNPYGAEVLQYDTTSGVMGRAIISWDGVDFSASPTPSLNLGDVDLTSGGASGLLLKLGVDLTGSGNDLLLRLFDDDATLFSEASVKIPVTDGTASATAFIPFDDFVGPVEPEKVNAIQMFIGDGAKSVDAQFDWIRTVGETTHDFVVAVPEPTTGLLLLIGLAGLFRLRFS